MNTSFEPKSQAPTQHNSKRENQNTKAYPSRTIVHAKLEMTEPGDHDEREADAVANTIVSGGKIARKISSGGSGSSGIAVSQQMESQLSQLQGGGRPMPQGLLSMMENGFGQDFGQVRIHTDAEAADMSSSISARAFTLGNDIYFNRGQFSPETTEGQRLVAHELTHVVQGTRKVGRWENPQYKYEKALANALEGKYGYALKRLLTKFYKFNLDDYRQSAVVNAYFYAIEHDTIFSTIKGKFEDYLKDNFRYEIPKETVYKISDTFDKNGLFEDDYKKAIQKAYDKALENRIREYSDKDPYKYGNSERQNIDIKWRIAADILYAETKEQAKITIGHDDVYSQLDRIEELIALRHRNAAYNTSDYLTTTNNGLISGETWTNIFLATVATELAVLAGPLAASFAAVFGGGTTATIVSTAIVNGTIDGFKTAANELNSNHYSKDEDKKTTLNILLKSVSSGIASALTAGLSKKFPMKAHEYLADVIYTALGDVLSGIITQAEAFITKGDFDGAEFANTVISLIEHALFSLLLRKLGDLDAVDSTLSKTELEDLNEGLSEGAVEVGSILNAGADLTNTVAKEIATN